MRSNLAISEVQKCFIQARGDDVQGYIDPFNNVLTMLQYGKAYEIALRYLKQDMHVLDWGCGNGHFSCFLTLQKIKTTGFSFDPSPSFLMKSQSFRFVQGTTDEPIKLPFETSGFDIVFSVGVLEHVREFGGSEIKSLLEIRRILKPGGLFICFHLPNRYQWVEPVGRLFNCSRYFHRRKFRRQDIFQLAQSGGFRIEEIKRYNIFPRNELRNLPQWLTGNIVFIQIFEFFDRFFSRLFPAFCTNYYFVARAVE
jgi:SAM-dependent methyltransferase